MTSFKNTDEEKSAVKASLSKPKMTINKSDPLYDEKETFQKLGWEFLSVTPVSDSSQALIKIRTALQNEAMVLINSKPGSLIYSSNGHSLTPSTREVHAKVVKNEMEPEMVPHVGVCFTLRNDTVVCFKENGELTCSYYRSHSDSSGSNGESYPVPIIKYEVLTEIQESVTAVENCAHNLMFGHRNKMIGKTSEVIKSAYNLYDEVVKAIQYERVIIESTSGKEWTELTFAMNDVRINGNEVADSDKEKKLKIQNNMFEHLRKLRKLIDIRMRMESIQREVASELAKFKDQI